MDHLSADLDPARGQLLIEQARLLAEVLQHRERLAQAAEDSPQATSGGSQAAALSAEEDACLAMLNRAESELAEVQAALKRLDDGSWGTCTLCGEKVAPQRLQAVPSAALCLECQQDLERRHSRPGN